MNPDTVVRVFLFFADLNLLFCSLILLAINI